jgi:hypothetical protein
MAVNRTQIFEEMVVGAARGIQHAYRNNPLVHGVVIQRLLRDFFGPLCLEGDELLSLDKKKPSPWQPIASAPMNREVLVRGKSGYNPPHETFYINAYLDPDYGGMAWMDATGTSLYDHGWEPTEWRELE